MNYGDCSAAKLNVMNHLLETPGGYPPGRTVPVMKRESVFGDGR